MFGRLTSGERHTNQRLLQSMVFGEGGIREIPVWREGERQHDPELGRRGEIYDLKQQLATAATVRSYHHPGQLPSPRLCPGPGLGTVSSM